MRLKVMRGWGAIWQANGIDWLICLGTLAEGIGASAIAEGMNPSKVFYVDSTKQMAMILEEYAPRMLSFL